ncbi:hypothetical protein B0H10DRAFT_2236757 [Mycena sp. CBHHK59/15]|nr:hypothetical protein B0H10DRAFT_2236757 [Mycena sp. CBHHK59/15]
MFNIILGRLNDLAPFAPPITQTTPLARILSPAVGALLAAMCGVKIRMIRFESFSPQGRRMDRVLNSEKIQAQRFFREDFFLDNVFAVGLNGSVEGTTSIDMVFLKLFLVETRSNPIIFPSFCTATCPLLPGIDAPDAFLIPTVAASNRWRRYTDMLGPDWPPFVITPQGPDNPGGWNTTNGWSHPGESSNVQVS